MTFRNTWRGSSVGLERSPVKRMVGDSISPFSSQRVGTTRRRTAYTNGSGSASYGGVFPARGSGVFVGIAQLVAHLPSKQTVGGSRPPTHYVVLAECAECASLWSW